MPGETTPTAAITRSSLPPAGSEDRAVLVLYEGDGVGTSTRVVELPDRAQFTIGRSRSASVRIDSDQVSRLHARFVRRGAELFVEDAGSRNGTWVNGERITGSRRLASSDEVVVGSVTVVVSMTSRVIARPHVGSTRHLEERLAAELDRGKRYQRACSLVMLRIEGSAAETDLAIDRVSAALRPMDVLSEYSPSLLAIVLPEVDASAAEDIARELGNAARTIAGEVVPTIAAAAGIATFPGHGTTPGALIARARAALASISVRRGEVVGVPPDDPDPSRAPVVISDPQMRRVYALIDKVADHSITVLVRGETGVGKEVIAGAIHARSKRSKGPLVRLNCASLPASLLESALYGHEKGAFTGADRRTPGFFEAAHGGTLFLDEIGEMSAALQAKLLRVLEERKLTRVGGIDEIEVDVRVVCATHRDLEADTRTGSFREDLFFRISAFTILVPPLRDRPDEIVPFAEHFIRQALPDAKRLPALVPAAVAALRRYAWPGNVRELRNAIERAVVLHTRGVIELEDLPDQLRDGSTAVSSDPGIETPRQDVRDQIADLERRAVVAALDACGGSQTEAAKKLGLTRRALIYRMEKHGLKPLPESRKPTGGG